MVPYRELEKPPLPPYFICLADACGGVVAVLLLLVVVVAVVVSSAYSAGGLMVWKSLSSSNGSSMPYEKISSSVTAGWGGSDWGDRKALGKNAARSLF